MHALNTGTDLTPTDNPLQQTNARRQSAIGGRQLTSTIVIGGRPLIGQGPDFAFR